MSMCINNTHKFTLARKVGLAMCQCGKFMIHGFVMGVIASSEVAYRDDDTVPALDRIDADSPVLIDGLFLVHGYWLHGKHFDYLVQRLTEPEFLQHVSALDAASGKFQTAQQVDDAEGMGAALAESFPHELALLL